MAAKESFLADTSAFHRINRVPSIAARWRPKIAFGLVSTCEVTELEVYYSARSAKHFDELRAILRGTADYAWVPVPADAWQRALEVQEQMIRRGTHRSAGLADLVLAATAEAHRLILLHDDNDFDCIAAVTGQPVRRVAD